MTNAADNEELDALVVELQVPAEHDALAQKALDAIRALRARVAELQDQIYKRGVGVWDGKSTLRELTTRAESAESQLRQVKADAERIDWIQTMAAKSNSGVTVDSFRDRESQAMRRYRVSWFHNQGKFWLELRSAIDAARRNDGTA